MADLRRPVRTLLGAAFDADRRTALTVLLLAPAVGAAGMLPALGVKWLVDATATADPALAVAAVLALVSTVLVTTGLGNAAANARIRLQLLVGRELDRRLILLSAAVPTVAHHDDPEHGDRMAMLRAHRGELGGAIGALVESVRSVVAIGSAVGLLVSVHPVLAPLPLCTLPAVLATRRVARITAAAQERTAEPDRLRTSLLDTVCSPGAAAEWRIYGAGPELSARHRELGERVRRERAAADVRTTVLTTACWLGYGVAFLTGLAFVAHQAAAGHVGPGDVALTITVGGALAGGVSGLVGVLQWLANALRAVGHYHWLVDHAAAETTGGRRSRFTSAPRPGGDLEFDRVSFCYPGSDRPVLRDVCLRIPAGTTVAVVGENGAGKSTLLSLVAGMYLPTGGEIRYDGVPLGDWEPASWRSGLTGCLQDFCRFEFPLRHTVGVGDLPRIDDRAAVRTALRTADAEELADGLPDGIDTQLGTTLPGGTDLSTGQWQRLALARAHLRPRPALLLLDEPTASLDPATEDALLTGYLAGGSESGGITIVVSHRFATVRSADLIVVLDGGAVAQVGTHGELLAAGGVYAGLHAMHAYGYRS